jgi:chromosome segregation ATPase
MSEDINNQCSLRQQWKKEKNCSICHSPFGVVGLKYFKKHLCKYCYKAICLACSTNSDQVDAKKVEIVCTLCSVDHIKDDQDSLLEYNTLASQLEDLETSLTEIREKIRKKKEKQISLLQKLEFEEKNFNDSQIEVSITHFRKDKQKLLEKSQTLKAEIEFICKEIDQKESACFELETCLMQEKCSLELDKKKEAELYKILAAKQDENIKLTRTLESFTVNPSNKKSHKQLKREASLRNAFEKLLQEEEFYNNQNNKLNEELNSTRSELLVKDQVLEKVTESVETIHLEGDAEESTLMELSKNLEDQQDLIKKLKTELETNKTNPGPITEKKCCLII